jgi:hypothetical protein
MVKLSDSLLMLRFVLETDRQCALLTDSDGKTALHYVCSSYRWGHYGGYYGSQKGISAVIGALLLNPELAAELVRIRDGSGQLALHKVCSWGHEAHTTVPCLARAAQLLKVHPEGASIPDNEQSLAAHVAASLSSPTVFRRMLEAHPASAEAVSLTLGTVHHAAAMHSVEMIECVGALCGTKGWSTPTVDDKRLPFHEACYMQAHTPFCHMYDHYKKITAVWSFFPEAIRIRDDDGDIPLHVFVPEIEWFYGRYENDKVITPLCHALPCHALPLLCSRLPCPALYCPAMPSP